MIGARTFYVGLLTAAIGWQMVFAETILDATASGCLLVLLGALICALALRDMTHRQRLAAIIGVIVLQFVAGHGFSDLLARWKEVPGLATLLAGMINLTGFDAAALDGRVVFHSGQLLIDYRPSLARLGAFPLALRVRRRGGRGRPAAGTAAVAGARLARHRSDRLCSPARARHPAGAAVAAGSGPGHQPLVAAAHAPARRRPAAATWGGAAAGRRSRGPRLGATAGGRGCRARAHLLARVGRPRSSEIGADRVRRQPRDLGADRRRVRHRRLRPALLLHLRQLLRPAELALRRPAPPGRADHRGGAQGCRRADRQDPGQADPAGGDPGDRAVRQRRRRPVPDRRPHQPVRHDDLPQRAGRAFRPRLPLRRHLRSRHRKPDPVAAPGVAAAPDCRPGAVVSVRDLGDHRGTARCPRGDRRLRHGRRARRLQQSRLLRQYPFGSARGLRLLPAARRARTRPRARGRDQRQHAVLQFLDLLSGPARAGPGHGRMAEPSRRPCGVICRWRPAGSRCSA